MKMQPATLRLGKPTDGENITSEQLSAQGANSSLIHVDWMIGSAAMDVDGISQSGEIHPLMRSGEWTS